MHISVLGWKTVTLRMGGQVELPALDVNVVSGINCIKISEDITVETHQNNIFGVNNFVKKYLQEM